MTRIPEIVIISMAKGWGGAEEYLELLARELTVRDIRYRIIVRDGGEYARRKPGRTDIVAIPKSVGGLMQFAREELEGNRRYVIHVNRYYDIFRGWYLKRKNPGSVHALYQHCYLSHPNRIPLDLTDGIVCISEYVKSSLTAKHPPAGEKITVIPTAINTRLFTVKKSGYEINGPVKVGMVGRFDKNQEELIEIGREVRNRGIDLTIHFAGKGAVEEEERLQEAIEKAGIGDHVFFHGYIPHSSMPDFYAGMDMVVSTMKIEGLSLVAMEAMACGVPFVAYNRAGFREIIDGGENGVLVSGGTSEFASAIEVLARSAATRGKLGRNAAEKANKAFGIQLNVDRYLAFMEELLEKKINP